MDALSIPSASDLPKPGGNHYLYVTIIVFKHGGHYAVLQYCFSAMSYDYTKLFQYGNMVFNSRFERSLTKFLKFYRSSFREKKNIQIALSIITLI